MEDIRARAAAAKDEAQRVLDDAAAARGHTSRIVGITGTPGSGKSSLVNVVTRSLLALDPALTIAVVAVDPSSPTSGGSLLGDRTRMRHDADESDARLYFRSQASVTALGGLAPLTFTVCQALATLFDCVLVETVGIGQSETDIRHLADTVYLVIAPNGGDDVQMLKAGIIEIPDSFIVNKYDEPAAKVAYHQLRASLWLARPFDAASIRIHTTSAIDGQGIDKLARAVLADVRSGGAAEGTPAATGRPGGRVALAPGGGAGLSWETRTAHFFTQWVREEWGRTGIRHLAARLGGAHEFLNGQSGFGAAQLAFSSDLSAAIAATPS